MIENFDIYIKSLKEPAKVTLYEYSHLNGCMEAEVTFDSPYDGKERVEKIVLGRCGNSEAKRKVKRGLCQILGFYELEDGRRRLKKAGGYSTRGSRKRERRRMRSREQIRGRRY